jgi:hypothetical protein
MFNNDLPMKSGGIEVEILFCAFDKKDCNEKPEQ